MPVVLVEFSLRSKSQASENCPCHAMFGWRDTILPVHDQPICCPGGQLDVENWKRTMSKPWLPMASLHLFARSLLETDRKLLLEQKNGMA